MSECWDSTKTCYLLVWLVVCTICIKSKLNFSIKTLKIIKTLDKEYVDLSIKCATKKKTKKHNNRVHRKNAHMEFNHCNSTNRNPMKKNEWCSVHDIVLHIILWSYAHTLDYSYYFIRFFIENSFTCEWESLYSIIYKPQTVVLLCIDWFRRLNNYLLLAQEERKNETGRKWWLFFTYPGSNHTIYDCYECYIHWMNMFHFDGSTKSRIPSKLIASSIAFVVKCYQLADRVIWDHSTLIIIILL